VVTNVESAEMIKYASNAFLATKISFINEMANICELVGADVNQVAKGMGLDQRIGSKFLHAGPGFGGSCFPKDTAAIATLAREKGYRFRIVEAVMDVNHDQRLRMAEKIRRALGGKVQGKTLGVLGLTFKPNTDDMRDAPSLDILPPLMAEGALVRAFDPAGRHEAEKYFAGIAYCQNAYDAVQGADALVLMTEWNQFRNLDWARVRQAMTGRVVIDLRNAYNPQRVRDEGFTYHSVGRP
jgi:UDPglucose 6-dehydrogenase